MELEMPSSKGANNAAIKTAVLKGALTLSTLDKAVSRILKLISRYVGAAQPQAVFDRESHHKLSVKMETECAVLLKNNGVLPLHRGQKIAYIGAFAAAPRYQGGGSSHINASRVSSALEAAKAPVDYAKGFSLDKDKTDENLLKEALLAAKNADTAVLFVGLPDQYECEGYDRNHMRLPDCQNELICRVAEVQPNTVVVLHNGSPVEMPWESSVSAILELYLVGQGVGEAADAILYGDVNPSGRLPESFPFRAEDVPSYLFFPGDGNTAEYGEGIYVGYRYYEKKKIPVQFPFGHGLSYTRFSYGQPRLSGNVINQDGTVEVLVPVKTQATAGEKKWCSYIYKI